MWNVMLDELPMQWNGYPLNMDFRIGIQLNLLLQDNSLNEYERFDAIYELLFPGIAPSDEELPEVIEWYLNGWYTDGISKRKETRKAFDFDADQWRIYSAFLLQYRIDLNTADLHYWAFIGLLVNLEECAFTRVKEIRLKEIKAKMQKEEKKALIEAKQIYSLVKEEEPDNKEELDEALQEFNRLRGAK